MNKAAVIIPNYNGLHYLKDCLVSLETQTRSDFTTVVVDNGSTDGSVDYMREHFPWVRVIALQENTGFCFAVNEGIRQTQEPYVILLNNDTQCMASFVEELLLAIERSKRIFSASACMLSMHDPSLIDDAGDLYSALGWAFAIGKDKSAAQYQRSYRIFASCGGAAIYRRSVLEQIGLLDEHHFAYLEDVDLGWRARIYGYENVYAPRAKVLHAGSGASGSRYNAFKVTHTSRNSVWIIRKNMPAAQIVLNLPFLLVGFAVKTAFFMRKGLGKAYVHGLWEGLRTGGKLECVPYQRKHFRHYVRIQIELWVNTIRRLMA